MTSASDGCPGCVYTYDWALVGDELTLTLVGHESTDSPRGRGHRPVRHRGCLHEAAMRPTAAVLTAISVALLVPACTGGRRQAELAAAERDTRGHGYRAVALA